jgi:phosphatidylglycerophosphate synthase
VNIEPWDARLARMLVRPLVDTPVTPNQITSASLLLAVLAAWLFADGGRAQANWAAALFMMARFIDHMDGALARMAGKTSAFGHWYDYLVGGGSYALLFLSLGIGLSGGGLGAWALPAGAFVAGFILVNMSLRMKMDRDYGSDTVGYPGALGFELEDGIYLLGPIAWLGGLEYFFVVGCAGTVCFALWTVVTFIGRCLAGPPGQGHR